MLPNLLQKKFHTKPDNVSRGRKEGSYMQN